MKRWLILLACCLQGLCLRAAEAMLTHEWRAETSRPAATSVTLRQGETVRLACTLVERAMPVTVPDDATSRFFWKDADADGNAYWSADAELEGNVVSFVWSPDRDAGCRRYAFFLSVESPSQGTIYRAFGLLVMQASPGFNPADLGAPDALQTVVEAVIGEIDGRYLKLTGGDVTGPITSRLSSASDPGLTVTLGNDDRYYAKHTQAGIQARREVNAPEEFYAFFDVSGGDKIARLKDLGSFLTAETDPTVPAWAKAPEKPAYTAAEVGAAQATHTHDDRYFRLDGSSIMLKGSGNGPYGWALGRIVKGEVSGGWGIRFSEVDLNNYTSYDYDRIDVNRNGTHTYYRLTGDGDDRIVRRLDLQAYQPAGDYLSSETDPTVPAWAKAASKPAYAWSEITGKPATYAPSAHTHAVSDVDGLQAALDEKQPAGDYARISGDWTEPDEIVIPEHVRLAEIFGAKLRLRVTDMSKSELLIVCDYFDDTGAISRSESCNVYLRDRVDELLAGHTHPQYLTNETDPTVPAWAKASSKPAYAWSEISGKPTTWAWSAITGKPATYAPASHSHTVSDISGLQTALKERAPIYSVTATRDGTTYVWVWDDDEGTFALAPITD